MTEEKEVKVESNGQDKVENENGAEEETKLESGIIRQVEYYFGDLNLPRDKFLREQVQLDDGWVPLDVLISFNRLAKLTTDTEVIANALLKSTSGLLEVSEDNKKVRRNPELPVPEMNEERRKELMNRTVYVKGFPKDAILDDILKFFKDHNEVENVIMRRYLDKQTKKRLFKGSVFATFKTREQAEEFMKTKDLKYGDTDLLLHWQEDYLKVKQEEYNAKKEMKEKKSKDKAEKQETDDSIKLPSGTLLHFSQGHDEMSREDVKAALTPLGAEVAFIDFKVGDTEGWVRLTQENAAKEVFEKIIDGKIKIGDSEVVFRVLEGEEEKTHLDKTVAEMAKRRKNQKSFSKQKGKNWGNKGGGGGRKRKQEQRENKTSDSATEQKKVKAD